MASLWIENEWSQLEEVVTGSAALLIKPSLSPVYTNPDLPFFTRAANWLDEKLFAGRPVNKNTRAKIKAEVENLAQTLLARGAVVQEVKPVIPMPDEPLGLNQLYPRDIAAVIGDKLIRCRITTRPSREKETRGIDALCAKLTSEGTKIIDAKQAPDAAILEGGDILVDLPYVFVGQGAFTSNFLGATWLQEQLGPKIIAIPVKLTRSTSLHLDCALALIGPKLAIADLSALPHPLPQPLNSYDIIDVGQRAGNRLATNVLVLNEKTIIISPKERALERSLEKRGWTVIRLPFNNHLEGGGGFHCATLPLRRI